MFLPVICATTGPGVAELGVQLQCRFGCDAHFLGETSGTNRLLPSSRRRVFGTNIRSSSSASVTSSGHRQARDKIKEKTIERLNGHYEPTKFYSTHTKELTFYCMSPMRWLRLR
jgi:hypothetical protein